MKGNSIFSFRLAGNFPASREYFARAIEEMEARDDEAVVRIEDAGGQAAAILVKDNAIPYESAGFERIFAYQYQILVQLFLGDVEAAAIEARNGLGVQQRALERHEHLLERERRKMNELSAKEELEGWSWTKHWSRPGTLSPPPTRS